MDSNDFFGSYRDKFDLGEFQLSEPQGAMTDEQKLNSVGFKIGILPDGREFWEKGFLVDLVGYKLSWVDVDKTAVLVIRIGGNSDWVALPNVKTVDDVLTIARLLGLSKEVE